MELAISRISSKGQIVIPSNLRKDIEEGDEFIVIKDKDRFIIKSTKGLKKNLKEDLDFASSIEKSWDEYDKGRFTKKPRKTS